MTFTTPSFFADKMGVLVPVRFDGATYEPEHDDARLTGQLLRVKTCMADGAWRTLAEIEVVTGDPQASISAQLRNAKKARFGSHTLNKRPRGDHSHGLWEYQLCN